MLGRLKFDLTELADEMLDNLSEDLFESTTTTFFDPCMGGGQFLIAIAKKLDKYGHSKENIASRLYGMESSQFRINYIRTKYDLEGNFYIGGINEFKGMDMKFDVVIGNPPYQSGNGQSKVYQHFYNIGAELVADDGCMTMIAPFAITRGFVGKKVGDVKLKQLPIAIINNNNIRKKYFPKVGIEHICYFVAGKTHAGLTTIINQDNAYTVDLSKLTSVPAITNNHILSIIEKCFDNKRNYLRRSIQYGKHCIKEETGNMFVLEKIEPDGTLKGFNVSNNNKQHNMHRVPRIVYNTLGKRVHIDYTHSLLTKPGGSIICVETQSDTESENLAELLSTTKLVDFYAKCVTGNNRSPFDTFILNFKYVDLKKKWTDDELYSHFNLTQEEIDYIENTIKD